MKHCIMKASAVLLALFCGFFLLAGCTPADKTADDYAKIETTRKEMETLAKSSARAEFGDQGQWYICDMRLMHENTNKFWSQMEADLGKDFNPKLSNGDQNFVGILPFRKTYRIYAGSPDEAHMMYPDWNYEALPKPAN